LQKKHKYDKKVGSWRIHDGVITYRYWCTVAVLIYKFDYNRVMLFANDTFYLIESHIFQSSFYFHIIFKKALFVLEIILQEWQKPVKINDNKILNNLISVISSL
jgi:hypothetical protein